MSRSILKAFDGCAANCCFQQHFQSMALYFTQRRMASPVNFLKPPPRNGTSPCHHNAALPFGQTSQGIEPSVHMGDFLRRCFAFNRLPQPPNRYRCYLLKLPPSRLCLFWAVARIKGQHPQRCHRLTQLQLNFFFSVFILTNKT